MNEAELREKAALMAQTGDNCQKLFNELADKAESQDVKLILRGMSALSVQLHTIRVELGMR